MGKKEFQEKLHGLVVARKIYFFNFGACEFMRIQHAQNVVPFIGLPKLSLTLNGPESTATF